MFVLLLAVTTATALAADSPPDTILLNGKVVVFDGAPAQALAVRDGKIARFEEYADSAASSALFGEAPDAIQQEHSGFTTS